MRTLVSLVGSVLAAVTLSACCGDCIKDPPCCPRPKKASSDKPAPPPVAPATVIPSGGGPATGAPAPAPVAPSTVMPANPK